MPTPTRVRVQHLCLCGSLAVGTLAVSPANAQSQNPETAQSPSAPASTQLPALRVTDTTPAAEVGSLQLDRPNPTGSRLNLSPLETPATVQTITGETLRQRGDRSVLDAVTRATGITGVATPGNGNAGLSVRGFTGVTSVMQLYDGVQLFVGNGTVTFPFDPWTVDRIDILSGPSSVLYGQGAIGGVVNVIPRRPDRSGFSTTGYAALGSFDTYRQAVDSTGPLGDRAGYRLDVSHATSGGYVDRGKSESLALSGSFVFEPRDDLKFTLSEDYGYQHPMGYFGTPLIGGQLLSALRERNYNVQDAKMAWNDNRTMLRTDYTPVDGVAVRNDFYYLRTDRHWREVEGYTFQPATNQILRNTYIESVHAQSQVGDHGNVTVSGKPLGHQNDFAVGFDVNSVTFQSKSNTPFGGTSLVNPYSFDPGVFINQAGTVPRWRSQTSQMGFYGEDRFKIVDSLSLVGGVRYDEYSLHRTDLVPYGVTDKTLSNTSWRLGTVYEVIPDLSLYFQYATAADPIGSLISLTAAQQAFTLATGDQFEGGIKHVLWGGRAQYTLAGYSITKNNLTTLSPTNPAVTQQVGQQSSAGFEAAGSVDVGWGLRIVANVTALDAQFDQFGERVGTATVSRKGNTPPNVPKTVANLWVDWSFADNWLLGAGMRYVGSRFADNANTLTLPSYTVVDAGIRWRPLENLWFDGRIYNMFDTLYAAAPYNGGTQWILGQPLAAEVSVTARF